MRLSNLLVGAFVVGSMFSACTTDEITVPKSELYAREFIKKFGVIDPSRDFSAAVHTGINVVTSAPTDVKVYADIDGKRYIFAEGRGIKGTTPIKFDIPKGVKEVIVDANDCLYKTAVGGTVTIAKKGGSRTIVGDGNLSNVDKTGLLSWSVAPVEIFPTLALQSYMTIYPEDKNNIPKGTNSFYSLADGENHTFYPFFWQTNRQHCLGIYVVDEFDESKITLQDLYYSKSGELEVSMDYKPKVDKIIHEAGVSRRFVDVNNAFGGLPNTITFTNPNNDGKNWLNYSFPEWNYEVNDVVTYSEATSPYKTANGYISKIEFFNYSYQTIFRFYETPITTYVEEINQEESLGSWDKVKTDGSPAYVASDNVYIRTRGITYNLPEGTRYGFYIRVLNEIPKKPDGTLDYSNAPTDFIIFSNANRNSVEYVENGVCINRKITEADWSKQTGWWTTDYANYQESDKYAYASWGKGQMNGIQYSMFGFEDWQAKNNNMGCDLNDIMFLFAAGEEPTHVVDTKKPEPEPYEWLIAAEDLGGYYDWDFNDAVFAVTAQTVVSGEGETALTNTNITVEPLAAGGTLPIYVMFNGAFIYNGQEFAKGHHHIGPELHRWLGAGSNVQINVRSAVQESTGEPITFTVEGEWSIADHIDNPKWLQGNDVKGMGGFYVLVNPKDDIRHHAAPGVKTFDGVWDDTDSNHIVQSPTQFAPSTPVVSIEMLCLQNTWSWPQEEQSIHSVYGSFQDWLEGKANTWYGSNHTINNIAKDRTVKRKARQ